VVCFARCHAPADYDVYHEHCLQQHMRQCKYLGMGGQNRSGTAIHAEYTKSAAAAAAAPGGGGAPGAAQCWLSLVSTSHMSACMKLLQRRLCASQQSGVHTSHCNCSTAYLCGYCPASRVQGQGIGHRPDHVLHVLLLLCVWCCGHVSLHLVQGCQRCQGRLFVPQGPGQRHAGVIQSCGASAVELKF
jgi:hypothetical protein